MTKQISFEFFPPQTLEGMEKLRKTWEALENLNPTYFSVTFGAGGSTRDRTLETVLQIQRAGLSAAPHLSCIGATRESLRSMLKDYKGAGVSRIVALRGDLPSGFVAPGEFRHASELVQFIRHETGDFFHLAVAGYPEVHPESRSNRDDIEKFVRKVEAGADSVITQYFYNVDAYIQFVDQIRSRGVHIPVIPGIMPIANFEKIVRFSDACGAELPRWMRKRFDDFENDAESAKEYGLDLVSDLCRRLLESGAPGLHFYTLNQSPLVAEICHRIGVA